MKKIIVAKTAGFCYGVERAVLICEEAAKKHSNCVTMGSIIHNKHVTDDLEKKGVYAVSDVSDITSENAVIIRAHGIGQKEQKTLEESGANIIDATCPDVKKIHDIVRAESLSNRFIVIIGERKHPEVSAIADWSDEYEIFETAGELSDWLKDRENAQKPISVVFQTTNTIKIFNSCNEILKKECTNLKTFDTICGATCQRQREAAEISKVADLMVVIGDTDSANSLRLVDICKEHCSKVLFVQSAADITLEDIRTAGTIGITAGASAPSWIIKEVTNKMSQDVLFEEIDEDVEKSEEGISDEESHGADTITADAVEVGNADAAASEDEQVQKDDENSSTGEESFEEMLEKSIKTLRTGEKVSGVVTSITTTEVSVDLGTKQSGYIPISEFVDDDNTDINDVIKIGDTVEAFVMRVNDVEGMVMLSKKRLDAIKNWDIIEAAKEDKTIVEGVVVEENKGGIVVNVKGIRVFVPASQIGIPKNAPISGMLKKTVKLRIREVNASRRRVVGSIRDVHAEERREKAEHIWSEIEVGKCYNGVVKSMTSYGVFVDIGGVDGMIHISEISWTRIKQPSDVMSVGDEVEVHVLGFDKEVRQISLGYKKSEDNPWTKFINSNAVGDVVNVKVVKMMPFGAFAEIAPGVDGLIHISQISDHRIGLPSEVLSDGQLVDVKITEIDTERKKISLSIRALLEASRPQPAAEEPSESETEVVYDTDNPPPPEPESEEPVVEEVVIEEVIVVEEPAEEPSEEPSEEPEEEVVEEVVIKEAEEA